ncbi:hypothetical protein D9M71_396530 [compost metagenome]
MQQAPLAGQGHPAIGPGLQQAGHGLLRQGLRRLFQEDQQQPQALAIALVYGQAPQAPGPPFIPAFGDFSGWLHAVAVQPHGRLVGYLAGDPAAGAAQPHQVRRVFTGTGQAGNLQQLEALAALGEHQCLVKVQQGVEVIGHGKCQRIERVGLQGLVAQGGQLQH